MTKDIQSWHYIYLFNFGRFMYVLKTFNLNFIRQPEVIGKFLDQIPLVGMWRMGMKMSLSSSAGWQTGTLIAHFGRIRRLIIDKPHGPGRLLVPGSSVDGRWYMAGDSCWPLPGWKVVAQTTVDTWWVWMVVMVVVQPQDNTRTCRDEPTKGLKNWVCGSWYRMRVRWVCETISMWLCPTGSIAMNAALIMKTI